MVPLRELLTPVSRPEAVDPQKTYHILGAHWYAKGLYTKDIKSGSQIQAKNLYRAEHGDFVYNRLFAWKGSFAVASEENHGCYVSNEFPCFLVNQNRIDRRYLWRYFSRAGIWEEAFGLSTGGTPTSRNRLKEDKLLAMKMPLPPVEEQRRTVAKIDNLAAKIKEVRGLRESAMEKADALLPRSRAAEFMVLADHFPNLPLDKLISMASGEGLTSSQMDDAAPYPVYGGGGLTGRYSQYLFEEPKIAIGRVGARCGCVFVTEPKSWITDNALYLTEISADLHPPYLVHALSTLDIRQQANQAAQPVVSQKKINPLTIPVPPIAEQQRIVGELDALQAEISSLRHMQAQTTAELDALLPSILDKAFKGEL
jgi:type I restriction enzyme S subunit